nr:hypothetical protein [Vibrio vulnificus]
KEQIFGGQMQLLYQQQNTKQIILHSESREKKSSNHEIAYKKKKTCPFSIQKEIHKLQSIISQISI